MRFVMQKPAGKGGSSTRLTSDVVVNCRSAEALVPASKSTYPFSTKKRSSSQTDLPAAKAFAPGADDAESLKPNPRIPAAYRRIKKAVLRNKLISKFHVEASIVDLVISSILDIPPDVTFDDIVGQEPAVKLLRERVVYPALNPSLFNGQKYLRPPRGVLLFGPTGNGKTLLAKACAAQTNYNFMNLTASVLVSKWVGDSEKIIKILFECAKEIQPCIIFIDEIDAVLSQRSNLERDDTRRFKNEFLTQFDGLLCSFDERIMVLGATNLPQSIDTAALRRFDLRIYLGPPDTSARGILLKRILREVRHNLSDSEVRHLAKVSSQYSASDLGVVARNAAWVPLGTIDPTRIPKLKETEIPLIGLRDFQRVMEHYVPSGYQSDMKIIEQWTNQHKRPFTRQCAR